MKKQILFLAFILLLLMGCQNVNTDTSTTIQNTEVTAPDTEGDNISDSDLDNIYYAINDMNITDSNVNSIPLYINLDKDSVAIFKYTNTADYGVTVTIKGVTDNSVYKKIEIPANSDKDIRFAPGSSLNEGESSCYTIDIYCSEVNLRGNITLQSATLK